MRQQITIRSVDLFAGAGGLALGVMEACRRSGYNHRVELANEWDEGALEIFTKNLEPVISHLGDVSLLFDGDVYGNSLTETEEKLLKQHPNIFKPDILTGGPPCQGHSDLNNHSRRNDPRNLLYYRMIRAAKVLQPQSIIIENVSTVIHSKENVVENSKKMLEELGYHVAETILWANQFGVPQKRKRHFLLAAKNSQPDLKILEQNKIQNNRTLRWAIEDLQQEFPKDDTYNQPAKCNDENQSRMDWLIDNNEYDLPNHLRPKCHQDGHNYPAVYGRMKWDEPSSTITAGFRSNGQGRFTHPSAKPGRPLTPHEAARIQTFPDWFSFDGHRPTTMAKTIGNAVPPLLAMHVANVVIQNITD